MLIKANTKDGKSIELPIQAKDPRKALQKFFSITDISPSNIATLQKID